MTDHYKHVMGCLETARNGRFCAGAEKAVTEIERLQVLHLERTKSTHKALTERDDKIAALLKHQESLEKLVATQAADEGLWFIAETAPEAYLQAALRKLHEGIEGKPSEQCALAALKGQA